MPLKNIRITEEVYNKLIQIKREDESFSDLLLRLLNSQKARLEDVFGTWDLTEEEKEEIWDPITDREGRGWKRPNFGD